MTVLRGGNFGEAAGNRCILVTEQSRSFVFKEGKHPPQEHTGPCPLFVR